MISPTCLGAKLNLGITFWRRTIRRDWNSPAVGIWLLSNECTLTMEVLKEGKERCNRLDPIGRLVSAANSMAAKKSKQMFVDAGMDFFDQHPYTFDVRTSTRGSGLSSNSPCG